MDGSHNCDTTRRHHPRAGDALKARRSMMKRIVVNTTQRNVGLIFSFACRSCETVRGLLFSCKDWTDRACRRKRRRMRFMSSGSQLGDSRKVYCRKSARKERIDYLSAKGWAGPWAG